MLAADEKLLRLIIYSNRNTVKLNMVEIERVKTGKQRREFVDFPNKLYKDVPEYLPSLYSEAMDSMNPKKNFAFEFCEASFWLARRNGKVVGRIGAIINHRADEKWNKKQMRFWQVDFIDGKMGT